ncbi:hypothetical protein DIPPA_02288 [Diplonema papillatum]|nr:hypothetical protein DIPPA_02288 [Diplonema papillatum]
MNPSPGCRWRRRTGRREWLLICAWLCAVEEVTAVTPTATISLSEILTPSATASLTATQTESTTISQTVETFDNYTSLLLPNDEDFEEGQELRAVVQSSLGPRDVLLPYFNWTAESRYEFRVYQYREELYRGCDNYTTENDPLHSEVGFGLSVEDFLDDRNTTFVAKAFSTFPAPPHELSFVICFRQTMPAWDAAAGVFPLNGLWQMLSTAQGKFVYRSARAATYFSLPDELPKVGQFVVMRLVSFADFNFTTPNNCTGRHRADDESRWACLNGDSVKLVREGTPCTFEPKVSRHGHPYLGSFFVRADGTWDPNAAVGLYEGATDGGVGVLSSPDVNPFYYGASDGWTGGKGAGLDQLRTEREHTAYVYVRVPQAAGRYEVCFSGVFDRRYTHHPVFPDDTPVWRKIPGLSQKGGGWASRFNFTVVEEDLTWAMLDLTPLSWGALRIQSPSPSLSRLPVIPSLSDNVFVTGGDSVRIIPSHLFNPPRTVPETTPHSALGSFSSLGCWPDASDLLPYPYSSGVPASPSPLEDRLSELGAFSSLESRDLMDDPFLSDGDDDEPLVTSTHFTMRLPPADQPHFVCYRKSGWAGWSVLSWTPRDKLAVQWRYLSAYPPRMLSPTPLTAGYYGDSATAVAHLNATVEWRMNDTREGTWGPLVLQPAGVSGTLSAAPNQARRRRELWPDAAYTSEQGTALRLTAPGFPCDRNHNASFPGAWHELLDAGFDECPWTDVDRGVAGCEGRSSDDPRLPHVSFYLAVPAAGLYQVCARRGALNWVAVRAAEEQLVLAGGGSTELLQALRPPDFAVTGFVVEAVEIGLVLSSRDGMASGTGGDYARLIFGEKETCDTTPAVWEAGKSMYDLVLSRLCRGGETGTCADPLGEFASETRERYLQGGWDTALSTGESSVVAVFSVPSLRTIFAQKAREGGEVTARLCYKPNQGTHWLVERLPVTPLRQYTITPASGAQLPAGAVQEFSLRFVNKETLVLPFHAKLVDDQPNTDNNNCLRTAAGATTKPYFLSQTFESRPESVNNQLYHRFSFEVPTRPGPYLLCIITNLTMAWIVNSYEVVDVGLRWHVEQSSTHPVNQGVSPLWLSRCSGAGCAASDTFDTDPGGDAAKVIVPHQSCEAGAHAGVEGGGVDGKADLGPSGGPRKVASFWTMFPVAPGDAPVDYKVCVRTTVGGVKRWFAVPEDEAAGYKAGGLVTRPAVVDQFGVSPSLGPATGGNASHPTGLAGAATVFVAEVGGADPALRVGFWVVPSRQAALARFGPGGAAALQFKLVRHPACRALATQQSCSQDPSCVWTAASSTCSRLNFEFTCLSPGHAFTTIPSPECSVECPEAVFNIPLSSGAPANGIGLLLHLPEPGSYYVCSRFENTPWTWLQHNGVDTLLVVDPLLQMDAGDFSADAPSRNVTAYDLSGYGGESRASWCGRGANEAPNCLANYQPPMRQDWVTVVNDTQVCTPALFPAEAGWVPLRRTGFAATAVAPGVVQFSLPPAEATASGQYRVCAFKASFAKIGNTPRPGAIVQPGVAYTLYNRAPAPLGTGGGTYLLTTGKVQALDAQVDGFDTTEKFLVWDASLRDYYSAIQQEQAPEASLGSGRTGSVLEEGGSRSVEVHAGELIRITLTARSDGKAFHVGTFPVAIETCQASTWDELNCDSPVQHAVSLRNEPILDGCLSSEASVYAWPADGGTQLMRSGELTYSVAFTSACQPYAGSSFGAGCGIRFVSSEGGFRSPTLWFSVVPRLPDGLILNGTALTLYTSRNLTCWHAVNCSMLVQATYEGLVEYAPRGSLRFSVLTSRNLSDAFETVCGWQYSGGRCEYNWAPMLANGSEEGAVALRIAVLGAEGGVVAWGDVFVAVGLLRVGGVSLVQLLPVDGALGVLGGRPPSPAWLPKNGGNPFEADAPASRWETDPAYYLVALMPYELRFKAVSRVLSTTVDDLAGWLVTLSFGANTAEEGGNRLLSVPVDATADTVRLTTAGATPDFEAGEPLPRGSGVFAVRFRLFNNVGCRRLDPCVVHVTLRKGDEEVHASFEAVVRVPASTLRVIARVSSAVIHGGLELTVIPSAQTFDGEWYPDEYCEGDVFALLTASADGVTTAGGVSLADTAFSPAPRPARHTVGWTSLATETTAVTWGASWKLTTTRPCASCAVSLHSTNGLGPTADDKAGGTFAFSVTDETAAVRCQRRTVVFVSGSDRSRFFNLTIVATTLPGVATGWVDWTVTVDRAKDFLQEGGSVQTGLLSLSQFGTTTAVVSANMEQGTAVVDGLYFNLPSTFAGGTYLVRAHAATDAGDVLECDTLVALVSSTKSQGVRMMAVHRDAGGESLCDAEGVLGCDRYAVDTGEPLRLKVRYYNGSSDADLSTEVDGRDLILRVRDRLYTWSEPCSGRCTTASVELKSSHAPIEVNRGGTSFVLSQGSAVVQFEMFVENGVAAPYGIGYVTIAQDTSKGYATPVRDATFEICDGQTLRGWLPPGSPSVACRTVRVWIRAPAIATLPKDVAIVNTSLPTATTELRFGSPACGGEGTRVDVRAALHATLAGVRYLVYELPFVFTLSHPSSQTLIDASSAGSEEGVRSLRVTNGIDAGMSLAERVAKGRDTVVFSFFGLHPAEPGAFAVSAASASGGTTAVARDALTEAEYSWPQEVDEEYPDFEILPEPQSDDECPPVRTFPRSVHRYKDWQPDPGRGWRYSTASAAAAAMVAVPFPIQLRVLNAEGERGWSFLQSPVVFRSKTALGGCNDGGNVTVFQMKSATSPLAGALSSFEVSPTRAVVTNGGQATIWVSLSQPCQTCVIEFALCYHSAAAAGLQACHSLGGTALEEQRSVPVSKRIARTAPFSVEPQRPRETVISSQNVPADPAARVGQPFSVKLEPVLLFDRDWLFDVPAAYKKRNSGVQVVAEVRARWADAGASVTSEQLRYGNGGFLKAGASVECEVSSEQFLSAAQAPGARKVVVAAATADQLRDNPEAPWVEEAIEFAFVRPCSGCEVWVQSELTVDGGVVSKWQAPLRVGGAVRAWRVAACPSKWLWAGRPPNWVRRRQPFSLTALRADGNNQPSWTGSVAASARAEIAGDMGNGFGGSLVFTSPLDSSDPAVATSENGSVTFRMEATRSCLRCRYRVADIPHTITVASTATQLVLVPTEPIAVIPRTADSTTHLWQFQAYLADDLADRTFVGGPTYIQHMLRYQQVGVPPVEVALGEEETARPEPRPAFVQGSGSIVVADPAPAARLLHGRYFQNGVPLHPANASCPRCGRPGSFAVLLERTPTLDFTLSHVFVAGARLPVHVNGIPGNFLHLEWSVYPTVLIFDQTNLPTVVSGDTVVVRLASVGALPEADRRQSPGNVTYYVSHLPFEVPPTVTVSCDFEGHWTPGEGLGDGGAGGEAHAWGHGLPVSNPERGVFGVSVAPVVPAASSGGRTARCQVVIQQHSSHRLAYLLADNETAAPAQSLSFNVLPRSILAPDRWSWSCPSRPVAGGVVHLLTGAAVTIHLNGSRADNRPTAATPAQLENVYLVMNPVNCFVVGNTSFHHAAFGPAVQWVGMTAVDGRCEVTAGYVPNAGGSEVELLVALSTTRDSLRLGTVTGRGAATHDGSPAASTGVPVVIAMHVVDAAGDVVRGDYNTSIRVSASPCAECCAHPTACPAANAGQPPDVPPVLVAQAGVVSLRVAFTKPTNAPPSPWHVPWKFSFTVQDLAVRDHLGELPPIYVVSAAARLELTLNMGGALSLAAAGEGGGIVPWVVGFPFSVALRAVDAAQPGPSVVVGDEGGAAAKVVCSPVGIPCRSIDLQGVTGDDEAGYNLENSFVASTCLGEPTTTDQHTLPSYWGACESRAIPTCAPLNWTIGSGAAADRVVVLQNGLGAVEHLVYDGPPGVVGLSFTSEDLLPGGASCVAVAAIRAQKIAKLTLSGGFVAGCAGNASNLTCGIDGTPFTAPPPQQPVQDENEAWYTPDRGLMRIEPASRDDENEGVFDLIVELRDEDGEVVRGDALSVISLRFACRDESQSRVDRFLFGKVTRTDSQSPFTRLVVNDEPDLAFRATVQNGRAQFAGMGFHGYCTRAVLFAECVTPAELDTTRACVGIRAQLEEFEVGSADLELLPPQFPPQDAAPTYDQPTVQLFLGAVLSCETWEVASFARGLSRSVQTISRLSVAQVLVHVACVIPLERYAQGIMGNDYGSDFCCADHRAPAEGGPVDSGATVTLSAEGGEPEESDGGGAVILGAAASTCSSGVPPEYFILPRSGLTSTVEAAARCCGGDEVCHAGASDTCFPSSTTREQAETICQAAALRLCSADEVRRVCCASEAAAGVACPPLADAARVWIARPTFWAANESAAPCAVVSTSPYVPSSALGFDLLEITATHAGCLTACCSYGNLCLGFTRSRLAPYTDKASCWLKRPHDPAGRHASSTYEFFQVSDDATPAPLTTGPQVACDGLNASACEAAAPHCVLDDFDDDADDELNGTAAAVARCREPVFCQVNEHVANRTCVACRPSLTRGAADEIGAGDTFCSDCSGVPRGSAVIDACGVCSGDNSSCAGCDGRPNSGVFEDPCGACNAGGADATANSTAAPECTSCAVLPSAQPGTRVIRGPDWQFAAQDNNGPGTILSSTPCVGGVWFRVQWDPVWDPRAAKYVSYENTYRAGCRGYYDLNTLSCVAALCPFPACPAASGSGRDVCEQLGCAFDRATQACAGTLAEQASCPCSAWTKSGCNTFEGCSWRAGACAAHGSGCLMNHRVLNRTCVPCASGTTSPVGADPNGNDTLCYGCDGVLGSGQVEDACGVCAGDNSTCMGCDGVPNSGEVANECGACGVGNCTSCAVTARSAAAGLRVARGGDWPYGPGVGGGWLKEQRDACTGGHWWTVLWDDLTTGWYRVGCNGAYDLASEACKQTACAAADSCEPLAGESACMQSSSCEWNGGACKAVQRDLCACQQVKAECSGACGWYGGSCGVNACDGAPACEGHQCATPGTCDMATGLCGLPAAVADGTPCEDGDDGTINDECIKGVCTPTRVCVDDGALLVSILRQANLAGAVDGLTCAQAARDLQLTCTSSWDSGSFASACCVTCFNDTIASSSVASRQLLGQPAQNANDANDRRRESSLQAASYVFVVEAEIVLGSSHPYPDEHASAVFSAVSASFNDGSELCASLPSLCREVRDFCSLDSGVPCPLVRQIDPVPRDRTSPAPPPPRTIVPRTRPAPLTPEELIDAAPVLDPASLLAIFLPILVLLT